ncbi:MAG: nicotinate-nucleotide adenylyltransferase [Candidatus Hydrogenedentes bacterium]|nr:nicotinate-nucleotide adenylyltransferase [Candidatus Hydrogenedentota bacterium]
MRIGIFGGTFDPIHQTHVAIGRAARKHKALEQVLFVVAADPPHKDSDDITPAPLRYAMVEAALTDEPGLEPCDIELHRAGPSYTVDTVKALRSQYPAAEFYLIIGEDTLIDLPRWYRPQEILDEVRLLVLPRPGTKGGAPTSELEGRYEILPFVVSDLSSTEVRKHVSAGESAGDSLHPAVQKIVDEKGLYHAHR